MVEPDVAKIKGATNSQFSLDDKEAFSNPTQQCNKGVADGMAQLTIYHQNIHGLKTKINEFILKLTEVKPHIICLSEHHLKLNELNITHLPMYKLGPNYCRITLKCGGVCIYAHNELEFTNISLLNHCKEQDLEVAALKLKFHKKKLL
jgi:hypothetical protein